jgi:hypothetical protein
VARKARFNKINNQVHAVFSRAQFEKNLGTKSAQHLCKNVMIEVKLSQSIWNLENFSDNKLQEDF